MADAEPDLFQMSNAEPLLAGFADREIILNDLVQLTTALMDGAVPAQKRWPSMQLTKPAITGSNRSSCDDPHIYRSAKAIRKKTAPVRGKALRAAPLVVKATSEIDTTASLQSYGRAAKAQMTCPMQLEPGTDGIAVPHLHGRVTRTRVYTSTLVLDTNHAILYVLHDRTSFLIAACGSPFAASFEPIMQLPRRCGLSHFHSSDIAISCQ
jgi:hypothetical protein